jgi:predicted AlkP superfamily phosphohydrolase/phosphomutase
LIGLDGAAPRLVFDRLRPHLPCLSELMARGVFGTLRSTTPPITVPAWACMVSGRDPGELGIYGFRDRVPGSRKLRVVTADDVRAPRIWDLLGEAGRSASVLYVPPTWPPRPIAGEMVSCLLTPGPAARHAFPEALEAELAARVGAHTPDVEIAGSAGQGEGALIEALHDAAARHFDAAEHLVATRRRDLLMMVEMGTDRLHHALWPALDPEDARHDPASPSVRDARDYYAYLDARIGRLIEHAEHAARRAGARGSQHAHVLVVSDHGARPLRGGVRINEWLRREGWLVLRSEPRQPVPLERADVDWRRTRAWAEGGYYARVWLNVEGIAPEGAVRREEAARELDRLEEAIAGMRDDRGRPIANRIVRPARAYRQARGTPPDLMVFLGDLDLRALGEVGGEGVTVPAERAGRHGADGCNHDWDGLYVLAGPEVPRAGRRDGASIHDVGVTALRLLGVSMPADWLGTDLRGRA